MDAERAERCKAARLAAMARLDGEAAPLSEEEVAAHLADCPECDAEIRALEAVTRDLRGVSLAPVTPC